MNQTLDHCLTFGSYITELLHGLDTKCLSSLLFVSDCPQALLGSLVQKLVLTGSVENHQAIGPAVQQQTLSSGTRTRSDILAFLNTASLKPTPLYLRNSLSRIWLCTV
jgi:hypothetical protein